MILWRGSKGRSRAGVLLALVALAGLVAGAVWYVNYRSTPEKTVQALIAAFEADDKDAVRLLLTDVSQDKSLSWVFTVGKVARDVAKPTFEVLEARRSGDEAVVPVRITVSAAGLEISPTRNLVLVREGWEWKLDVERTRQDALDDILDIWRS